MNEQDTRKQNKQADESITPICFKSRKDRKKAIKVLVPTLLNELEKRMDNTKTPDMGKWIMNKYRLKDIKNRDLFELLNFAFIAIGAVTVTIFLHKKVNAVSLTGAVITIVLGTLIFWMVKKYGVRAEEKETTPPAADGTTTIEPERPGNFKPVDLDKKEDTKKIK
jgi:hypothetical protein